jgi:hypothetical protein
MLLHQMAHLVHPVVEDRHHKLASGNRSIDHPSTANPVGGWDILCSQRSYPAERSRRGDVCVRLQWLSDLEHYRRERTFVTASQCLHKNSSILCTYGHEQE